EGEKELMNQEENSVNSDKDLDLINSENITDINIDAPSRRLYLLSLLLPHDICSRLGTTGKSQITNAKLKMNAAEIYIELLRRVQQEEIEYQDVPKVFTIANWIKKTS
ncbi:19598_t:CDS:2, partial [Racocetra persica]